MPIDPSERVQRRFRMRRGTRLLIKTYAELMGISFEDAMDQTCLYGIAYLNQRNEMNLMDWMDTVKLPKLVDVDSYTRAE